MTLGKLVAQSTGVETIKSLVTKNFRDDREILPLTLSDSYVRASGMADLCPREEVICALYDVIRYNKCDANTMMTFAHGSAIHWCLQNKVLPHINVLIGEWICLSCGKIYGRPYGIKPLSQSLVTKPLKCETENCKSDEFYYKELHFKNDEYRIGGHPDGFLKIPGMPGIGLLEAKSASTFSAMKIQTTPYMSHVVQCQIYMWLTNTNWAKILYWDKGAQGVSVFTEHTVYKDDTTIQLIKTHLMSIWDGLTTKTLPEYKVCDSASCDRAKKCPVSDICFTQK